MANQNNITATSFEAVTGWNNGPKKPVTLYSSDGWIAQADAVTDLTTIINPAIQDAIEHGKDISLIIKTRSV